MARSAKQIQTKIKSLSDRIKKLQEEKKKELGDLAKAREAAKAKPKPAKKKKSAPKTSASSLGGTVAG